MNQQIKTSLGVAIIIIFAATIGFFAWKSMEVKEDSVANPVQVKNEKVRSNDKACTDEAKQCPDGSYVSRTGANCEFAICPGSKNAIISFEPSSEVNNCQKNWQAPSVYKVLVNEKEIGSVQKEGCNTKIRFIGKNSDFAYFEIQPVGIGGYIVTDIGYFEVYQINLADNKIKKLEKGIEVFDKDFRKIIVSDVENRKVILKEIASGVEKNIKIPDKYVPGDNQLGDFHFSPNLEKIAMKFVYGMPGEEICEIYFYDTKSETLNFYKKIDYLIQVKGWKNNEEVDWVKFI